MTSDIQAAEIDPKLLTKLSICLWKLDSEASSEGNFQDQDKAQKTLYKQKAKKLMRLLGSRELTLSDKG